MESIHEAVMRVDSELSGPDQSTKNRSTRLEKIDFIMQPTEEQQAILNATGRVIRVNARAGTGKTTTLRMLSEKYADKKILYLVFNRKAREEAQSKFPPNVKVKTVHSLAREGTGKRMSGSPRQPTRKVVGEMPRHQVL